LRNAAHVLARTPGGEARAIKRLDQALEIAPRSIAVLAGRSILLARAGRREEALRDAQQALRLGPSAAFRFQLAGTFARTSTLEPRDARRAIELLDSSLADGFGRDLLATDPDLAPVRNLAEF